MSLAVLVNPRSRANRRDPALAERLARIVGDAGHLVAPHNLDELAAEVAALVKAPPSVIAVHGGDGTLHTALNALLRGFGAEALPPLAILGGGTMNVVPSSLGIRVEATEFLHDLVDATRRGAGLATLRRRCLQVGDRYGFVFGNGFIASFLDEYYAPRDYSPGRALGLLGRSLASAVVGGGFARRVLRRYHGGVTVDGRLLPRRDYGAISVATVREVGLGMKFNHRADEDPDRFSVLAIHAEPVALALDLVAVRQGRGISPERAWSAVASRVRLEPDERPMPYTIDGDLYRADGPLDIGMGPALALVWPPSLVRPGAFGPGASTPAPREPASPLPTKAGGDTMGLPS